MTLLRASSSPWRGRFVAQIAAIPSCALGLSALSGWWLNVDGLKCVVPGSAPLKPNIAAGLLLCGVALAFLASGKIDKWIRYSMALIALLVITLAALTLGEIFFGWDLGIDQLLIPVISPEASSAQRMFPTTALCFLLAGGAILSSAQLGRKRFKIPLVAGLATALVLIGLFALSGLFFEMLLGPQWNVLGMNVSGISASLGFLLIGSGLLAVLQSEGELSWSLDSRTTAGFVFGIVLMIIAAAVAFNFTKRMLGTTDRLGHRQETLKEIQKVMTGMADLLSSQRIYVITGDERLLENRERARADLDEDVSTIRKLTANDPKQQRHLGQLRPLIVERILWDERVIAARRQEGMTGAAEVVAEGTGIRVSGEILHLLENMQTEEYRLLQLDRNDATSASSAAFLILPLGVLLSLAILSLGMSFLNSGLRERTEAENALRRSDERIRATLDSALDCIITMDHHGQVVEFNPAAEKTFGYRRDEAIGQLLSDLIIPPALREGHRKGLAHYLATGEAPVLGKRLELTAMRRDQSEFPVELAIVRIAEQKPPLFTGFIRDITERQKSESALKQAEEKYRSIFENAAEGIFQTTPDGKYLSVNPAMARMYGYNSPEALMNSVGDIGSLVYVDPKRRHEFKRLIAEQGYVERFELEVYQKDGRPIWLSENARAIRDENGSIMYYEGAVQDITERKRADTALKEAEEKYRSIVENAVEGVFQTTPDGKFITANLAMARIFGFDSPQELVTSRSDIAREHYVNPRTREEFKRLLEEEGEVHNFELEVYRKDGRRIWLSENVRALRDEAGLVVCYEGTAEDVTKRKRVEEMLRASEAHLQAVVENLDEGVVVSDMRGKLLHWNRAALDIHGYTHLIQGLRSLTDFVDTFELRAIDGTLLALKDWPLARILRGEHLHNLELRVRNKDATWERIFNYGGTLVRDPENQPLMAILTVSDITDRKRAEEQLLEQADIINHAQDAIIIRNFDDRKITFWNEGAERLYGWRAEEKLGLTDVMTLADPGQIEIMMSALTSTGEFRGEVKQLTKDGKEVIADVRQTLVRDVAGAPRSILIVCTDVTERKKLEIQLLRSQRLESIGTLAGGVAHDLNNILTPILMCAETLRSNPNGEDRQTALSMIEDSARRGAGVVKQVLTFARGVEGERVAINPRHLIEEIVDIARKTFSKSIEIWNRPAENLWSIQGDPTQLHQVLLNLCVNARDAMPNGGSITIAAENLDIDENYASMTPGVEVGPHVMLRVSDTGSGMPRATIDKIFDPFFTTKEVGKGTGLGLSTALGIVKSHGGAISVYSEIGAGTNFKIFLPAQPSEEISAKREHEPKLVGGHGELVLVVDDEPNILSVTKLILEKHNYGILDAHDAPEALALIAQKKDAINLVLTDISMPYMDGVALIRTIKKIKPNARVIASTGQGDEARVAELRDLGVTNFLSKPYDTGKLLTTIKAAMETNSET
jgi:PAS domain S-box-containing protein